LSFQAGKATLLNLIAGLLRPDSGTVKLNDLEITSPGPDRGVVFQTTRSCLGSRFLKNIFLAVDRPIQTGLGKTSGATSNISLR